MLQHETIELGDSLTYEERLVRILDSKVRSNQTKDARLL